MKKFAEEQHTQFKLLRYQFDIQASQLQAKDREITEKDKEKNRQQKNHDNMVKLLTDQRKQLEAEIKTLRCSSREVLEAQMVLSDAKNAKVRHEDEIKRLQTELSHKDQTIKKLEGLVYK
jgi:predicted RNase H-like nuclease (RuvC/YqgF family)